VHGRGPLTGPARFIAFGAGAGELIADKQPNMPSRWSPRGLTLRLAFSITGGHVLAGTPGAGVGAAAALATAFTGSQLRSRITGPVAQLAAAVAEDALSYSMVLTATSSLS
jgi:uncharacterized membrane protein